MNLKYCKLLLLTLFSILSFSVSSQNLLVGIGGGGGTYKMNPIKDFNSTIVELLPFKPELTDNFPPYFLFQGEILYQFPRFLAVGAQFYSTSTGARLTLGDYSGHYTLDNIQQGLFPGVRILLGKAPGKSNGFNLALVGGMSFSQMKTQEKLVVFEESLNEDKEFNSEGWYIQPGVCYFHSIWSGLKVGATASYFYGLEGQYHLSDDKKQKLFNSQTNDPIKPQWEGFRMNLSVYWSFGRNP